MYSQESDSHVDARKLIHHHEEPLESEQHTRYGVVSSVQRLFSLYTGQLLSGCGDARCTEILCYTGRLNTSHKPIRKYTSRAARAIALGIIGGPLPRSHLCKHFLTRPNVTGAVSDNHGPRDPSSMIQLLCDTESIRNLEDPSADVVLGEDLLELKPMHEQLDGFLKVAARIPHPSGVGAVSNRQLADGLMPCISWLLCKVPLQRLAPWTLVNREFISKGLAYPQKFNNTPTDEQYNTWLAILDALANEPCLRLLARAVHVIARRSAFFKVLTSLDDAVNGLLKPQSSVAGLLAAQLCTETDTAPIRVLALIVWSKKLFAKHWDGQPVVQHGSICHGALDLLTNLYCIQDQLQYTLPADTFEFPLIASSLSMVELAKSYMDHVGQHIASDHLFSWNMLFTTEQLTRYFRMLNHLTMRVAHSDVERAVMSRRRSGAISPDGIIPDQLEHAEQHYLLLNVSRDNVLTDAFDQLWQRRKGELRRPLRVRLGETNELEIGHDLGGVQIEFFNLVCREAFSEQAQMFTTDPTTGYSYFRPGSLQPLYMFEIFGSLVALALYNGITLPITLPRIFYTLLSQPPDRPPTMDAFIPADITDGWPVVARSLQSILEEHVAGLSFSYPVETNGVRLAVLSTTRCVGSGSDIPRRSLEVSAAVDISDGKEIDVEGIRHSWPGWDITRTDDEAAEVVPETRREYVQNYVRHLCYGSVITQLNAFLKGFHGSNVINYRTLILLSPENLKTYVEGTSRLDINELKAATRYDGFDSKSKYIHWFWRIVTAWPEAKQKQLLKFVTAAERIPISGANNLTFIIKKSTPENPESLPTSSTCFGTLILPRYTTAEVLAEKLNIALRYGTEGFGNG